MESRNYLIKITIFVFFASLHGVSSQQCYNLSCIGERCLSTEVTSNPLLIPKCKRVFYRGCYTITTSTNGFSTTTTGCIDNGFECMAGSCSGLSVKAEVTCCNSDLCNDGQSQSSSYRNTAHFEFVIIITGFALVFQSIRNSLY